jgi:hypothetical protein
MSVSPHLSLSGVHLVGNHSVHPPEPVDSSAREDLGRAVGESRGGGSGSAISPAGLGVTAASSRPNSSQLLVAPMVSGKEICVSNIPSIKGGVFSLAVEDLSKLVSGGEISQEELDRRLEPEDLEHLEQEILTVKWYPIRSYARILALLRDTEGGGSNEYLRKRGARSAESLLQAGLYQQLEYLKRTQLEQENDSRARFLAFGRDLRLLTTLSGSILNFARWASKPDPDWENRYVIEVSEAYEYPEVLCWTTDGFINQMATRHGEPYLWRWERERPDVIVFRMVRSV